MKFPSAFAMYVSTIHGLISGMSRPFLLFPDPAPLSWWQDQTCTKNCVRGSGLSASLRLARSMRTNVEIDEMLTKLRAHLSPSRPIFGRLHPDCSRQKAACHDAVKARCSWKQSCYSRGTIKNLFKDHINCVTWQGAMFHGPNWDAANAPSREAAQGKANYKDLRPLTLIHPPMFAATHRTPNFGVSNLLRTSHNFIVFTYYFYIKWRTPQAYFINTI